VALACAAQQPRMTIQHHGNGQNSAAPAWRQPSRRLRPQLRIPDSWRAISIADMLPLRESTTCCIESHLRLVGNPQGVKFSGDWYKRCTMRNVSKYPAARLAIALGMSTRRSRGGRVAAGRQTIPKFIEVVLKITSKSEIVWPSTPAAPWLALTSYRLPTPPFSECRTALPYP